MEVELASACLHSQVGYKPKYEKQPNKDPRRSSRMESFITLLLLLRGSFTLVTQPGVQWCDLGSPQPPPQGSSDSSASASRVAGITDTYHHTRLIVIFLVEMGFHHAGQACPNS